MIRLLFILLILAASSQAATLNKPLKGAVFMAPGGSTMDRFSAWLAIAPSTLRRDGMLRSGIYRRISIPVVAARVGRSPTAMPE